MGQGSDPFSVQVEGGAIPDRRIVRDRRGKDVSDVLADPTARFPFTTRFSRSVYFVALIIVGGGFFALFGRMLYLQLMQGGFYRDEAEHNRIKLERILPTRGLLYDRNGAALVKNKPNFEVYLTPSEFTYDDADVAKLALAVNMSVEDMNALLEKTKAVSSVPIIVKTHLAYEEAIAADITLGAMRGVSVIPAAEREYIHGAAFAHVLGYVGKITDEELQQYPDYGYTDIVGKAGIEASYESALHGVAGEQQIERDFLNSQKRVVAKRDPVAGADAYLALDVNLQQKTYDALKEAVDQLRVPGASAVAIDPRSGAIRAMVNYPSYDPNAFVRGLTQSESDAYFQSEQRPLFNRAISGEYPSGSTIKPAIAAAALHDGIITPRTTVLSTGGLRVGQWFFPDWRAGGHGVTNVYHAIADSVNTFFYTIGGGYEDFTGLGVEKIAEHLRRFGLSNQLGIDIPGEQDGFLPSKQWKEETKGERWYIGDTYNLSIGQGDLLVTPLQMASVTATIANGGTLYRPHILDHLLYPDGREVRPEETVITYQVEDTEAIRVVQDALRQTVTDGSARSLASLPVSAAAKTGTAQFGDGSRTHAWFITYAPFDNPEIAIAVIVEGGGEGSSTAAPIARQMLQAFFGL